ncbi:glycosyltransferase family 2 protein [Pyruvatibacter mobilis]|uniref:glycosyltransferase family 2 protein n=1 Tax=Pyruvatibacter mobilis TaxID=1712261 RepID=UPI003BAD0CE4
MTSPGPAPLPGPHPVPGTPDPAPENGVSFVVPVYNKARVLPPVLDAMAAQKGDFPREFIFVDDGSTDDSLDVVRAGTAGWDNVQIICQENAGSAAATNTGISAARMPFLKFVDADDLLTRDATVNLLTALRDAPDAIVAYGDRAFFPPGAEPDLSPVPASPAITVTAAPLAPAIRNSLFNPTQFMTRTEIARACGGCDERVVFSQEYSLTMRLARHGSFLHLDQTLAYLLDDSVNRLSNNQGRQLQRVTKAVRLFVADYPDLDPALIRFACRRNAARAWRYARRERGAGLTSAWYRHYLRGSLGLWRDPVRFIRTCEAVYDH